MARNYGERTGRMRNFLATDEVPKSVFGIPIVSDPDEYTDADLAFFRRNPEAGGYYDMGSDDPWDAGPGADAAGGREVRTGETPSFLSTDELPETLFGVPIVAGPDGYTDADLEFFRKNPEAGGYYDMGSDDQRGATPDDGTAEGAPVQDDEPKAGAQTETESTGARRREFAMSFEQPLRTSEVKQPDGTMVKYVHPRQDDDGQITAGGYHFFVGASTGKLMAHTNTNRITYDQWSKGADALDKIFTGLASGAADELGIAHGSAGENVLWDLAFNLRNRRKNLSREGSPKLYGKADRLKASFPRSYGTVALLLESASYGTNKGRNMARGLHLLDEMRRSDDRDARLVAGLFDDIYKKTPEPASGTRERRDYTRYKTALDELNDRLTPEPARKPASKPARKAR